MIRAERSTINPAETYLHLSDDGSGKPLEVGDDFWTKTIATLGAGWLVTGAHFEGAWEHWEMHPKGEELIFLVSGRVELIVEDEEGEHAIRMEPGQLYLVRRGVWHRAVATAAADTLFVTSGEGTQHRPL